MKEKEEKKSERRRTTQEDIYIYARCKDDEKSDNAAEDKSRESKGKPKDKRKEIEQKKGTEEGVRVEAKRRLLFL